MASIQLSNVANWHADKACAAYHAGDIDLFTRHVTIADRLRRQAHLARRAEAA